MSSTSSRASSSRVSCYVNGRRVSAPLSPTSTGDAARRIIPAATLVIVVVVLATYRVLGPITGNQTAIDARWTAVFLANFHFASLGSNYFTAGLPPSPLLNFWSLAVEEQFYLFYPTLFLLVGALQLRRWSLRARLIVALGAVIGASFAWSVLQTASNPEAAYYSPLTRAWELALGALVAVAAPWLMQVPQRLAAWATWLGLVVIGVSAVWFGAQTPFPGAWAAVPVVGAALVIAGGTPVPRSGHRTAPSSPSVPVVGDPLILPLPVALAYPHPGRRIGGEVVAALCSEPALGRSGRWGIRPYLPLHREPDPSRPGHRRESSRQHRAGCCAHRGDVDRRHRGSRHPRNDRNGRSLVEPGNDPHSLGSTGTWVGRGNPHQSNQFHRTSHRRYPLPPPTLDSRAPGRAAESARHRFPSPPVPSALPTAVTPWSSTGTPTPGCGPPH